MGALILPDDAAFNWKDPDYAPIYEERAARLLRLREHPDWIPNLREFYRETPAQFITDWGITFDPRNADVDLPTLIPFILTPRQIEWIDWVLERWRNRENGLNEKSRDMGVTWLAVALSCTLCLFRDGVDIGFGSRKEEYVDEIGTMKPILPKGRMFMRHVPKEFRGDWVEWRDAPKMQIRFPETGSIITGEAGDSIGRGDRKTIYFVDEAAHLPRAQLVEQSLSQTTNCRIDISSVNGMANLFAQKRWSGKVPVFVFDWRDDPRKDEAWYAAQVAKFDPVTVAQEIDRDYAASVEGVVIPGSWVRAAIGACEKLGIEPTGAQGLGLDVADEGTDQNAAAGGRGVHIDVLEEWSGKNSDIFGTVQRAFALCEEHGLAWIKYDADGLGAGVRGDARILNEQRAELRLRPIPAVPYRGSGAVLNPDAEDVKGRKNKDYFANYKAQQWWAARLRFQKTFRWVTMGMECDPDEIVSLDPNLPLLMNLVAELSQATYSINEAGKLKVNKTPDGMKSPNSADAVIIRLSKGGQGLAITPELLAQSRLPRIGTASAMTAGGMAAALRAIKGRSRRR